jgi:hypothetical protein
MKNWLFTGLALVFITLLSGCSGDVPEARKVSVPNAQRASDKFTSVNERIHPVIYIKLGDDILRPIQKVGTKLPTDNVGPYELRGETLAAALQLVLGEYKVPLAFETGAALKNKVTVSGLSGRLDQVVERLCGLANLYCSYEDDMLTVKDTETFAVPLPPLGDEANRGFLDGLRAITGSEAVIDNTTQTLVYTASHRVQRRAQEYFERLRANTALIVFETQIWEVNLSNGQQSGIDWEQFSFTLGNFTNTLSRAGNVDFAGALGIGSVYTSNDLSFDTVLSFLTTQGAVKAISQPQVTVLSGSEAELTIGNKQDYIKRITISGDNNDNTSLEPDTIETGTKMKIKSSWDNSTIYGKLEIEVSNLIRFDEQSVSDVTIKLPQTSERKLTTNIRVRPGDSIIIGGLVEERDDLSHQGVGWLNPLLPTARKADATNTELVFMLRPRVVIFSDQPPAQDYPVIETVEMTTQNAAKAAAQASQAVVSPVVVGSPAAPEAGKPQVVQQPQSQSSGSNRSKQDWLDYLDSLVDKKY